MGQIVIILLLALVYFGPTVAAYSQKNPNRVKVLLVNFFLGWTFVGWVIAAVMSVKNKD